MAGYEEQRLKRIQDNKRKMEELNLRPIAYETMDMMKHKKRNIKTMKPKHVTMDTDEYIPNEEEEEESTRGDVNERVQSILRPCSKKVMASGTTNSQKSTGKPQVSNASMASLVLTRSQICKNGQIASQATSHQETIMDRRNILPTRSDDAIGKFAKSRKGQDKTMVAPESLGIFLRMKEKLTENIQVSKKNDFMNQPKDNLEKLPEKCSRVHTNEDDNGHKFGLVDEDEEIQCLGDFFVEEQLNVDQPIQNTSGSTQMQDTQTDRVVLPKEKRMRGPTMCKEVNNWTQNDRRPIFLNEHCQPVGLDKETLRKFSQFYGSLARDSVLAPLNFLDWRHVPNKDKLWEYVKRKGKTMCCLQLVLFGVRTNLG